MEKQCAHFFGVTINEHQAEAGVVVRVTSAAQSKFKVHLYMHSLNSPSLTHTRTRRGTVVLANFELIFAFSSVTFQLLYFEQDTNGGYGLALQVIMSFL